MTENEVEPGGFAITPKSLLTIWKDVPPRYRLLLTMMFSFRSDQRDTIWPTRQTLAALTGVAEPKTITLQTDRLVELGFIWKQQRKNAERNDRNDTCLYLFPDFNNPAVIAQIVANLRKRKSGSSAVTSRVSPLEVTSKIAPLAVTPMTAPLAVTIGCHHPGDTLDVTYPGDTRYVTGTNHGEANQGNEPKEEGTAVPGGSAPSPAGADAPVVRSASDSSLSLRGSGEAVGIQPATVPAGRTKGGSKTKGRAKESLTNEDRYRICSSLEMMRAYLLWGRPGLEDPNGSHPPSNLNWRQFRQGEGTDEKSIGIDRWGVHQFAGYFWHSVSTHRAARGAELSLPDWGRLNRDIKTLLGTGTNWRTFNHLGQLALHFDVICCMAGNHCKDTPLDETVINHNQIRQAVNVWLNAGDAQRAQWAQDYRQQIESRELRLYGRNFYFRQAA